MLVVCSLPAVGWMPRHGSMDVDTSVWLSVICGTGFLVMTLRGCLLTLRGTVGCAPDAGGSACGRRAGRGAPHAEQAAHRGECPVGEALGSRLGGLMEEGG